MLLIQTYFFYVNNTITHCGDNSLRFIFGKRKVMRDGEN